jgi:hypothetical protein
LPATRIECARVSVTMHVKYTQKHDVGHKEGRDSLSNSASSKEQDVGGNMVVHMEAKTKESKRRDSGGPTGVQAHGMY